MIRPQLFSNGEKVNCASTNCTPTRPELHILPDVQYGNTYHIREYEPYKFNRWFVSVSEMPEGCIYSEDMFAPLIEIKEVMEQECKMQQ